MEEEEFADDDPDPQPAYSSPDPAVPRFAGLGPIGRKMKIRQIQEEQREASLKKASRGMQRSPTAPAPATTGQGVATT